MDTPIKNDTQEFVGRKDASRLLGVGERTVTRWVDSGVLHAWKTVGGKNRISKNSVETLLQERKIEMERSIKSKLVKILVVEDDPVLLEYYVGAIESWGYTCKLDTAEDGFEGMLKIGREKPDLIITDLNMPGMDGFKMIRSLKSKPEYADIHIITVTALDAKKIDERGGLPECVQVFDKPAPMDQLKMLIVELTEKGSQT